MTEQEIEKLREKLGDGFEVTAGYNCAVITVKDIWDGVEFAEFHDTNEIFKVKNIKGDVITLSDDTWLTKNASKPSTEPAYVEQLKTKAKDLYGEIKDGDRFEFTWIGDSDLRNIHLKGKYDFYYDKESDTLDLHGFPLYQQGNWAKKLPQYIVTPIEIHSEEPDIVGDQVISIRMKIIHGYISQKKRKDVAYHLAKCLEDYLNKSQ